MSAPRRWLGVGARPWAFVVLAGLVAGCDGGSTGPDGQGPPAQVRLSVSVAAAAAGGEAAAYDVVDGVRIIIRTSDGSVLYDDRSSFNAEGSETRVPINVPIDGEIQATLEATLFRGADALFMGTASLTLSPAEVTQADLVLVPVAAGLVVPDTLPTMVSIGETQPLGGDVLFATGDVAGSLHPLWTSLTPGVVAVQGTGASSAAVAVSPGTGQLRATYGTISKTVGVRVVQVTAQVAVQPATSSVAVGGTVQLSATAQDAQGHAIPGRSFTWTTSKASVATVDPNGLVTAVGGGTATIEAASDGATGQATVEVTALAPAVQTAPADQIGANGARLNGTVDALGSPTTGWFEWGTDPELATSSRTPDTNVGSEVGSVPISSTLDSAEPNTTYYFRAVAQNQGGTTRGSIESFTTVPLQPPLVATAPATNVGETTATIGGYVNPQGAATSAWIEWGASSSLSTYTATATQNVGSGASDVGISADVSDLAIEGRYYYRVAASNAAGTVRSDIASFRTRPPAPSGLSAYTGEGSDFYLQWTDNSSSETSFVVERSALSASTGFTQSLTVGANTTYAYDGAPYPAEVFWYRVVACNASACSLPSNAVQVTSPPAAISGTLYLCYSSGTSNCSYYGSQTVTLSGASSATTTSNLYYGYYDFYNLVGTATYTVSVSDATCADFRTNQITVTPGWGETMYVDFYADTLPCALAATFLGRRSQPFDPVIAARLGLDASP